MRLPAETRLARHVSQQLLDAVRSAPERVVEITLKPEELGRVKMGISIGEGTISVSLVAERSETAELLRRHLEILNQEFKSLGPDRTRKMLTPVGEFCGNHGLVLLYAEVPQ